MIISEYERIKDLTYLQYCDYLQNKYDIPERILRFYGRNEATPVEHPMKRCDKSLWQKAFWDFFVSRKF